MTSTEILPVRKSYLGNWYWVKCTGNQPLG